MPLHAFWQVWSIPEIDGDIEDSIKFSKAIVFTDEEKSRLAGFKEGSPEWLKVLNDVRNSRKQGD